MAGPSPCTLKFAGSIFVSIILPPSRGEAGRVRESTQITFAKSAATIAVRLIDQICQGCWRFAVILSLIHALICLPDAVSHREVVKRYALQSKSWLRNFR